MNYLHIDFGSPSALLYLLTWWHHLPGSYDVSRRRVHRFVTVEVIDFLCLDEDYVAQNDRYRYTLLSTLL